MPLSRASRIRHGEKSFRQVVSLSVALPPLMKAMGVDRDIWLCDSYIKETAGVEETLIQAWIG